MIKFTATKLKNSGKKGILKPDNDGYYTLLLGALNAFNASGIYYPLEESKKLFEKSSPFIRKIKNGCLKCEAGHPKKTPQMSNRDFLNRISTVEETNVAAHISDVWLDDKIPDNDNIGDGVKPVVYIWGKVKPAGPMGKFLSESLNNVNENVCFSIRSLVLRKMVRGVLNRVLDVIVTFDWVTEAGIAAANKWSNPGLEGFSQSELSEYLALESIDDGLVDFKDGVNYELCDSGNLEITLEDSSHTPSSTTYTNPTYYSW